MRKGRRKRRKEDEGEKQNQEKKVWENGLNNEIKLCTAQFCWFHRGNNAISPVIEIM